MLRHARHLTALGLVLIGLPGLAAQPSAAQTPGGTPPPGTAPPPEDAPQPPPPGPEAPQPGAPPPAAGPPPPPPPVYSLIAPSNASPGQGVLVRGSGFPRRQRVTVTMNGRPVAQTSTNSIGNFATGFVVPPGIRGTVSIVSQAGNRQVATPLQVFGSRRAPLPLVMSSYGASLRVTPGAGRPGWGVRIAARGLPRNQPVFVYLGTKQIAKGKSGPAGGFFRRVGIPRQFPGRRDLRLFTRRLVLKTYLDVLPSRTLQTPPGAVTLGAVGDIACQPGARRTPVFCQFWEVGSLMASLNPTVVAPLGDVQYHAGAIEAFATSFDVSWGPLKSRMRPTPGNHEYLVPGAGGYFTYFGSAAAPPNGYYSYNLGSWHIVVLNSNCTFVACGADSPQLAWLRSDLARNARRCTLAYFHHPRFSSAGRHVLPLLHPMWSDLYNAGVDVVLNGHAHIYERFAPQDTNGNHDPARGIRQFTVGTGGVDRHGFAGIRPNSQIRSTSFGALYMVLRPGRYEWRFVTVPGRNTRDGGLGRCH